MNLPITTILSTINNVLTLMTRRSFVVVAFVEALSLPIPIFRFSQILFIPIVVPQVSVPRIMRRSIGSAPTIITTVISPLTTPARAPAAIIDAFTLYLRKTHSHYIARIYILESYRLTAFFFRIHPL